MSSENVSNSDKPRIRPSSQNHDGFALILQCSYPVFHQSDVNVMVPEESHIADLIGYAINTAYGPHAPNRFEAASCRDIQPFCRA